MSRSIKSVVAILFFTFAISGLNKTLATDRTESPEKQTRAPAINNSAALVVVSHVDVMPPFTNQATGLLSKYRNDTLKDRGVGGVQILQQVGRPNHFTIVEEWKDNNAYDTHVSDQHTREFRSRLQSMLGAPFDERPHESI